MPESARPEIKQGEIYFVRARDLDVEGSEQKKGRPYVIVSRDYINRQGHIVIGVPLTSQMHQARGYRLKIQLAHMVPNPACPRPLKDSVVLTDHIRVLDPGRLEHPKMGEVSETARGGIEVALAAIFDIR